MNTVKRFRLMAVRLALGLTTVVALVAYAFSAMLAKGILLGGIAGVLVFWLQALNVEKLASAPKSKVRYRPYVSTFIGFAIYALALGRALTWDKEFFRSLYGAIAGLFSIKIVILFLGITGFDLKTEDEAEDGTDR